MALSREDILNANDRPTSSLEVPEWGGSVNIRVMSGTERDQFEAKMASQDASKLTNVRAALAATVCVDDEGKRLFNEKDITALGEKSSKALTRIFNEAMSINGFTDGDVEKLEKN